jgi:flagellar P-ring protein precursor FlgI
VVLHTRRAWIAPLLCLSLAGGAAAAPAARIKDLARLEGVRPVPLIGYGLVAGLNRTGDRRQTIFSAQTLTNMLQRLGVVVPGDQIKIENIAAVMVTAELSPYARSGSRFDVLVSSVGDARSLQGGTLLATVLRAPDGSAYAIAQGPMSIGGFGGGQGGNSVQVNHLTSGRVPGGGWLQVNPPNQMPEADTLRLSLIQPDFTTATRLARAINRDIGADSAHALDPGTVTVRVPEAYRSQLSDLMARVEMLPVDIDTPARVVINERTGTVVVGSEVRIGEAAVAHGNLSVRITTKYTASQPAPFSKTGETVVVPDQQVDVTEGRTPLITLEPGATLDAVVKALNALGATPRDIIAILQALQAAGALQAEIVII